MDTADNLASTTNAWCFAKPGQVYATYVFGGAEAKLQLPQGTFTADWFDIRNGADLITAEPISGPGVVELGKPPRDLEKDWVVLLRQKR